MRPPLTIIIPTFNEERNILATIGSAAWADEIFVVDSFSTDKTVGLATSAGARVIQHEYINSAAQKNWAIPQATHEWVMILDADERITPDLRTEIESFLANPGTDAGLRIFRDNHFAGRPVRYSGWQDDSVLRVFRRAENVYPAREVHSDAQVPGPVRVAKAHMLHYTFENFEQYMRKFNQYTTWAAGDRAKTTRRVNALHLLGRPIFRFLKQYVLRLGFLDGRTGIIVCMLAAFSVFMKYAKLWERQQRDS